LCLLLLQATAYHTSRLATMGQEYTMWIPATQVSTATTTAAATAAAAAYCELCASMLCRVWCRLSVLPAHDTF
jgi:hypothetical protein